MKLHISLDQADLSGFKNINVTKDVVDLANLDPYCAPSECTEIIVHDVLKFISYAQLPLVIDHLVSRLRHNGKLTIIFIDINPIIRSYKKGDIDEEELNKLLFTHGAKSCFSKEYIKHILEERSLDILTINATQEQVIITAKRP